MTQQTRPHEGAESSLAAAPSKLMLPVVLAAQFVIPLSISGTAVALPLIAGELGAAPVPLQAVVNGFNLAFALSVVIWGVIADRIGPRASFRIGTALAAIGGLGSVVAPNLGLLDGARVLAGVGAAAVLTGSTSILSNRLSGAARDRAFALFGTANGLGLALGPTIASALIALGGWRTVFGAHAVVLLLALLGTAAIPAGRTPQSQADKDEPRGRHVDDGRLLGNPRFLAMCLVPVAGAIGFVTLVTYLPGALGAVLAMAPTAAGVAMIAMTAPVVAGPLLAAWLVRRFARLTARTMVTVSLLCLVAGALGLMVLRPGTSFGALVVPMVLVGFGFGLPIGMVDGEALAAVPARLSGTAAGVLNLFRIGGEAVAVAGYGWLLSTLIARRLPDPALAEQVAAGRPGQPAAYASALHPVLLLIAALVGAITIAVLALHRRQPR